MLVYGDGQLQEKYEVGKALVDNSRSYEGQATTSTALLNPRVTAQSRQVLDPKPFASYDTVVQGQPQELTW
jgi:hypothetical protein